MSKIRALSQRKKVILGALTLMLILVFAISIYAIADSPYEDGQVHAEKEALSNGDGTYKVTINVTGEPFSTGAEAGVYDVVLVIDNSGSMNYNMSGSDSTKRLTSAKTAAINFVNTILGENADDDNQVALVKFAQNGTEVLGFTGKGEDGEGIEALEGAINGMTANGGTNIQEGLAVARKLIDNDTSNANKIVILLSDGEPTYSISNSYWDDNEEYWDWDDWDWHDSPYYYYFERAEMGESDYPSSYDNNGNGRDYRRIHTDRIIIEANKIRSLGAQIYSVGIASTSNMESALGNQPTYKFSRNFGGSDKAVAWKSGSTVYSIAAPYSGQATNNGGYLIPDFESFKVDYATEYFTANTASELNQIFQSMIENFDTVAEDGVLTDVLPEYFDIDIPNGASQNGDVYTWTTGPNTITYNTVTRVITWNVGSIGLTKTLTYTVKPVVGYWGDGYTNATTNLTATAVDDNPEYTSTGGAVDIDILSPVRKDDGDVGDKYAGTNDTVNGVDRKTPINILVDTDGTNSGVMDNDTVTSLKYISQTDNGGTYDPVQKVWIKTVDAQPYLINGTSYNPQYGSVVQKPDGSFTYTYDTSIAYDTTKTVDYFYYYLADADGTADTASDPIKVTINLKELATVTAEYRNFSVTPDEITGKYPKIDGDKTIIKQVDETVNYDAVKNDLTSQGFVYDHGVPELKAGNTGAIDHYTVVSGTNTLVLYYVSSDCTVDVYFRDADTDALIGDEMDTLTGTYGDSYTEDLDELEDADIAGYTYSSTDNPNDTENYLLENEDITIYFTADDLDCTIHYVDVTDRGSISEPEFYTEAPTLRSGELKTGKIGETIIYTKYPINGYNQNGGVFGSSDFTDPEHDIYVCYTKKTNLSVTIRYVLKGTDTLIIDYSDPDFVNPVVKNNGTFGDTYTVDKPATIGGYKYDSFSDTNGGVFKDPCDTVYVYYVPRDTSVDVKYVEYDPDTADHIGQPLDDDTIEGKYGDVKTVSTPDITGTDGYVYTYHIISNPYQGTNTDPKAVNMEMGMDTDIIVFMTKTPVEIDVYFYELNHTTDLHTPETLEGYVGGSYEIELDELEDTQIDGFTHDKTDPNSVSGARIDFKYTDGHGDIIIYYTRVETTITVLHKYTDDNSYFGDDDERDGDYEDTTSIDPITPKDGYDFVGYEVNTDEGDSLTAYDGSGVDAEFGLEDYTVTMLYAPTTGTINVYYLEKGNSIGDANLAGPKSYYGNYAYDVIDVRDVTVETEEGPVTTTEEYTRTVPADVFYREDGTDHDIYLDYLPDVTGYDRTGSITMEGSSSEFSSTDFEKTTQNIIVWYERETIELPLEHVDESGNKLVTPDETISGDFGTSFTDEATAKIKTDIKGYTYKEMTTTNLVGTTYPSPVPDGAMVCLVYKQKPVSLTVKYLDIDTGDPVKTSTTMPEDGSNGYYGDSFTLPTAPTVIGYNFVSLDNRHKTTESDYKGTYPDPADKEDIIYYYEIKEVSVDVEYVEAVDGGYQPMNNGDDDYTITKDFGSSYSVSEKSYNGFTYDETINGNSSTMSESMSTIYVVYTRNSYQAEVRYVEAGDYSNEIADSANISGLYGSDYADQMPAHPSIHGWTQEGDVDYPNDDAVFTGDEEQIIYVPYTRNTIDMTLRYQLLGSTADDDDIQDPYGFSGLYDTDFSLDNDGGLFDIFGYTLYTELPITGTYQDDDTTVFAYYQKNFYSYPVEYRYTGDSRLLDTGVVSGYYGDSYDINIKSFNGYKYDSTDDPFGGVFSDTNSDQQVITVWYDRRPTSPHDDDDDEDDDDGGDEVIEDGGDDTPYNPPVVEPEEPVDEPVVEVPEEEVPNAPVPDTGGTTTYLIPILGLIVIAFGGYKLAKSKKN